MADEPVVLIALAVSDEAEHVTGARVKACETCKVEVSVAPSGLVMMLTRDVELLCYACGTARMMETPEARVAPPTIAQLRELWRMMEDEE